MNSKCAEITKDQIKNFILPIISKNKRRFSPKVDLSEVVQCMIYKLKTGVQWQNLFIDLEGVTPPFFFGNWSIIITENGWMRAFLRRCFKCI